MRSIEDIQAEIDALWEKIGRAKDLKAIFIDSRGRIVKKRDMVKTDAYDPFNAYDITRASKWRGDRENKAADMKRTISEHTKNAQKQAASTISELDAAIEKLDELIEKWKERIEHLEAEKDEIESMQESGNQEAG